MELGKTHIVQPGSCGMREGGNVFIPALPVDGARTIVRATMLVDTVIACARNVVDANCDEDRHSGILALSRALDAMDDFA